MSATSRPALPALAAALAVAAMPVAAADPCHAPVPVTAEAERQPGGGAYAASTAHGHGSHGHAKSDMKGAHMMHEPRHGGAFFMAPDKIHHLEAVYTDACGLRLYLYNAFTKPIHVDRFRAAATAIPASQDEPEVMRFLTVVGDGTILAARFGDALSRPFEIELYVGFPESDDPQLFNVRVPAARE